MSSVPGVAKNRTLAWIAAVTAIALTGGIGVFVGESVGGTITPFYLSARSEAGRPMVEARESLPIADVAIAPSTEGAATGTGYLTSLAPERVKADDGFTIDEARSERDADRDARRWQAQIDREIRRASFVAQSSFDGEGVSAKPELVPAVLSDSQLPANSPEQADRSPSQAAATARLSEVAVPTEVSPTTD